MLWEDMTLQGNPDRVVAIAGYRSSTYGVKYVAGLEFIYKSGVRCQIGYTHGERTHEVQLRESETISRLEITMGRYGILDVIVSGTVCSFGSALTFSSFTARVHVSHAT